MILVQVCYYLHANELALTFFFNDAAVQLSYSFFVGHLWMSSCRNTQNILGRRHKCSGFLVIDYASLGEECTN